MSGQVPEEDKSRCGRTTPRPASNVGECRCNADGAAVESQSIGTSTGVAGRCNERGGAERVDEIARAVYDVFRARGIRSAELPAGLLVEDGVVWPGEWSGYRRAPAGMERPFEQVPAGGGRQRDGGGGPRCGGDGGGGAVARGAGGVQRGTASVAGRLDAALELGVGDGRLRVDPDGQVVSV